MAAVGLHVLTFKWNGWRNGYTAEHVNKLYSGVSRNLTIPHKFICITDDPEGVECETYPCWTDPKVRRPVGQVQDCYRRLKLFSLWAAEQWPGWILQMDLDALVFDSLDDLITRDRFRILEARPAPYNGSLWLHQTGTMPYVWDDFDPVRSPIRARKRKTGRRHWTGSDQAWMSHRAPGAALYTAKDGVYRIGRGGMPKQPENGKLVFFPGPVKPWHEAMKKRAPWAYRLYHES